jgi:hypothetical protein
MTDAVIARIGLLAVSQPSHPVVTDRKGRPIGDVAMEHFDYDNSEADDDLPGVHLPNTDDSAETTGVETIDQDPTPDDITDVDMTYVSVCHLTRFPLASMTPCVIVTHIWRHLWSFFGSSVVVG